MPSSRFLITSPAFPLLLALTLPALAAGGGLADQLRRMAHADGFVISGLEKLRDTDTPAGAAQGGTAERVRALLADFDYVIVHGSAERVRRVIIIGAKRPAPPSPQAPPTARSDPGGSGTQTVLKTRREGDHHLVGVVLVGAGGQRLPLEMLVDTGASMSVLPLSRAAALGLDPARLPVRELTTAKGKVQARVGTIAAMELGGIRAKDLEVAFVEDAQLAGHALLGMNLLSRYMFILDEEHDELTLVPEQR
jgi:aspartyl protease family protein